MIRFLAILLLVTFGDCSHFYPYQHQQYFAHQTQAVFGGETGFSSYGIQPSGFFRPPGNFGPNTGWGNGGVHGGHVQQGGGIHGGNNFQGGIHGGNGWGPFPYPGIQFPGNNNNFGWGFNNQLKPSLTGWDTSYNVPCGDYTIHPFVSARIQFNSGIVPPRFPTPGKKKANTEGETNEAKKVGKSYFPYFPPVQPSPAASCHWNFQAAGCRLKFSCSHLQLPALFQCEENVMEYNDTQRYLRYCGSRKLHESLISDSGQLKLTFRSRPYALPSVINCAVHCTPELLLSQPPPLSPPVSEGTSTAQTTATTKVTKPVKLGRCKCGTRRTASSGRIVGGKRTAPGEFPWTVALVKRNSNRPFCGGSLINSRFVLTAAHCVQKRKGRKGEPELEVLLNEYDISKVNSVPGGTVRAGVEDIVTHPSYDKLTYDHDLALLRLDRSIDFQIQSPAGNKSHANTSLKEASKMQNEFDAQFIPICLPGKTRKSEDLNGAEGIVTGWGLTQEGGIPSNSMMQATVNIFNDSVCEDFYADTDVITKQMMCVGHPEGKMDSCVGDSGGPLVVKEEDHYSLAGIVSWGRGCGRPNLPGVYTKTLGLTDWITEEASDGVWCES